LFLEEKLNNAQMKKMSSGKKDVGLDFDFKITDGKESKIVTLEGGAGSIPGKEVFAIQRIAI
jgi:hypothetical protein